MAHAEATALVATDAETLWREIGSFQGVGAWHPMLDRVEGDGEEPGALRTAYTAGGAQVERLLAVDAEQHWHRYRMESTPLALSDYTAELRVVDRGEDSSLVAWTADFDVGSSDEEDTVGAVRGFLEAGVGELAERYGRPV